MNSRFWMLGTMWALALAPVGCGDDSSSNDDAAATDDGTTEGGADADAEAGADADADAEPETEGGADADADADGGGTDELAFQVVDGGTEDPLEDVQVLVQTSAGDEWLVTDLDGNVALTGLDLAGDPPTVSFFLEGYGFVTYVGVDRQLTEPVALSSLTPGTDNLVHGTVGGIDAAQDGLVTIWSPAYGFVGTLVNETTGAYSRSMPLDQTADTLLGQAFAFDAATGALENYVHATLPYSGGDATFDFALPGTPPALTHVTVTLAWPAGFSGFPTPAYVPTSPLDVFEVIGSNDTDGASFGLSESVAAGSSPAGLQVGLGWVTDRAGFAETEIGGTYTVAGDSGFEVVAQIFFDTLPADGATIDVLAPPEFTAPAAGVRFDLSDDTAAWTVPGWSSYTMLFLMSLDRGTEYWTVVLSKAVTTFRFPTLPASFRALPAPLVLGAYVRGWEGSPASVWELFELGDTFTAEHQYYGSVYDVRSRAQR